MRRSFQGFYLYNESENRPNTKRPLLTPTILASLYEQSGDEEYTVSVLAPDPEKLVKKANTDTTQQWPAETTLEG